MDSKQVMLILSIVTLIAFGFVLIGACLYAIPICFIRRFHKPLHLLSLNVCIAALICTTFWIIFTIMTGYSSVIVYTQTTCLPISYLQITLNCEIVYALCTISLNRLYSVVYPNKALFRTKKWVAICVFIQWIFVPIITTPLFASSPMNCLTLGLDLKSRIYTLIIIAVIPAIFLAVTNSIIFKYTHRSSNRVIPTNGDNAPNPALGHRDTRLLKHMIFMFAVLCCGWLLSYVLTIIVWNGPNLPSLFFQVLRLLPPMAIFINIIDLFWYNHELRSYLTNKINNRPIAHITQ